MDNLNHDAIIAFKKPKSLKRPKTNMGITVYDTDSSIDILQNYFGDKVQDGLTRSDMHRLLVAVMTCNEEQMEMILDNPKVPVAIKAVARRVLNDAREGELDAIERLWDRLFGKPVIAPPVQSGDNNASTSAATEVLSRESYVYIRDTLMK